MKRSTLECWKAIGLLLLFGMTGSLGAIVASRTLGVWRDSGFAMEKFPVTENIASARFLFFIGVGTLALSAWCVVNILRYDLSPKRNRKR